VGAAVVLLVAGWIALRSGGSSHPVSTETYLPGVAADVHLPPSRAGRTAVVVLIPGGGGRTADRRGFGPFAETLASHGMVAMNATYRAADSGARFPVPVGDVVCAVDFAALAGAHFRTDCPYPPVRVDGLLPTIWCRRHSRGRSPRGSRQPGIRSC
jgi:hypothetical protein